MVSSRKHSLKIILLLVLALVVTAMIVPGDTLKKVPWIGQALEFVDTVAPGFEASHVVLFGALGFVARFGWPRGRAWHIATGVLAVAVLVETVQIWVPGRDAEVSHAILATLGGVIGFTIAWLASYAWGTESLPDQFEPSTHWVGENSER